MRTLTGVVPVSGDDGPMRGPALLLTTLTLVSCGGGLTRMQAAARDTGASYLDLTARDAARAAGVTYSGCPAAQTTVSGGGENYEVQACQQRVRVHCEWGPGAPACTAEPELEAMREAQSERVREAERAVRAEYDRAPVTSAPRASAPAAAFRRGSDGVLQMDAVDGFLELRMRASAAHPESVLVSSTITSGDIASCDHALALAAAGETTRIEASQRDGSTTHYVISATDFATLGDRTPIRMSVCGQTLAFGHPALRALRSFIEADAGLRHE